MWKRSSTTTTTSVTSAPEKMLAPARGRNHSRTFQYVTERIPHTLAATDDVLRRSSQASKLASLPANGIVDVSA